MKTTPPPRQRTPLRDVKTDSLNVRRAADRVEDPGEATQPQFDAGL
jgi:hypothetical protein